MQKIIMLSLCLLLAGCHANADSQAAKSKTDAQIDAMLDGFQTRSTKPEEVTVSAYAAQIKEAVEEQLPDANQWQGKVCTFMVEMDRAGKLISAQATGGDSELCDAGLKAMQSATFPPMPNDNVYQVFKKFVMNFKL